MVGCTENCQTCTAFGSSGVRCQAPLPGLFCALSSQGCPVLAMCFALQAVWWIGANACLSVGSAVGNLLSCPSNAFKLLWLLILYVNFVFNILSKSPEKLRTQPCNVWGTAPSSSEDQCCETPLVRWWRVKTHGMSWECEQTAAAGGVCSPCSLTVLHCLLILLWQSCSCFKTPSQKPLPSANPDLALRNWKPHRGTHFYTAKCRWHLFIGQWAVPCRVCSLNNGSFHFFFLLSLTQILPSACMCVGTAAASLSAGVKVPSHRHGRRGPYLPYGRDW